MMMQNDEEQQKQLQVVDEEDKIQTPQPPELEIEEDEDEEEEKDFDEPELDILKEPFIPHPIMKSSSSSPHLKTRGHLQPRGNSASSFDSSISCHAQQLTHQPCSQPDLSPLLEHCESGTTAVRSTSMQLGFGYCHRQISSGSSQQSNKSSRTGSLIQQADWAEYKALKERFLRRRSTGSHVIRGLKNRLKIKRFR